MAVVPLGPISQRATKRMSPSSLTFPRRSSESPLSYPLPPSVLTQRDAGAHTSSRSTSRQPISTNGSTTSCWRSRLNCLTSCQRRSHTRHVRRQPTYRSSMCSSLLRMTMATTTTATSHSATKPMHMKYLTRLGGRSGGTKVRASTSIPQS